MFAVSDKKALLCVCSNQYIYEPSFSLVANAVLAACKTLASKQACLGSPTGALRATSLRFRVVVEPHEAQAATLRPGAAAHST